MSTVDARIAERRKEVRDLERRRRLRRTITGLVIVVVLIVGFLIERSPLVALENIEVVGAVRLDPERIRETAALPLGTSTLRLRLRSAEERLETLPLVADADVRRVDPLTVRITVTERVPILVAASGGRRVLVAADGVVIATGRQRNLPVVRVGAGGLPAVGESASSSPPLQAALTIHLGISGPLRTEVARYDARAVDDVDLELHSGIVVRIGSADRLDEKSRALGAVLEDLGSATVGSIDVRAPLAPVVRP